MVKLSFPRGLTKRDRELFKAMIEEYSIDDPAGLSIMQTAMIAKATETKCQRIVDKEGLVYFDRFNRPKNHPLLTTIRDARSQYLQALRQLNLDLEPLKDRPGRPAGGKKR